MLDFILNYLPAILMFAVATMVIYTWGLLKAQRQPEQLAAMMYRKCENKIKKALKNHETITRAEAEQLLKHVTVGLFYSKHRMGVTDPKTFTKSLLDHMQQQGLVAVVYKDGKNVYRLHEETKKAE